MYCRYCGNNIPEGSTKCPRCNQGAPVVSGRKKEEQLVKIMKMMEPPQFEEHKPDPVKLGRDTLQKLPKQTIIQPGQPMKTRKPETKNQKQIYTSPQFYTELEPEEEFPEIGNDELFYANLGRKDEPFYQRTKQKIAFSLGALLLNSGYFAYYKLYEVSILLTVLILLLAKFFPYGIPVVVLGASFFFYRCYRIHYNEKINNLMRANPGAKRTTIEALLKEQSGTNLTALILALAIEIAFGCMLLFL